MSSRDGSDVIVKENALSSRYAPSRGLRRWPCIVCSKSHDRSSTALSLDGQVTCFVAGKISSKSSTLFLTSNDHPSKCRAQNCKHHQRPYAALSSFRRGLKR